jgi:predicted rRNA methylase YqxC with S4 and FtsJ domains
VYCVGADGPCIIATVHGGVHDANASFHQRTGCSRNAASTSCVYPRAQVRVDERVVVLERTNLRLLPASAIGEPVDIATLDLSFISVLKVLPAVVAVLAPGAHIVILIKPQFEAGPENVSRGGVVRDARVHAAVVAAVREGAAAHGLAWRGVFDSPIRGAAAGNKEFLAHFVFEGTPPADN